MSEGRKYPGDRTAYHHELGYVKIVPNAAEKAVPLFCSICSRAIRSHEDETACIEFDCCYLCALSWAHPRRDQWAAGWRPTSQDVESNVSQRPLMSITIQSD